MVSIRSTLLLIACVVGSSATAIPQVPDRCREMKPQPTPSYEAVFGQQIMISAQARSLLITLVRRSSSKRCPSSFVLYFRITNTSKSDGATFTLCNETVQIDEIDVVSPTRVLLLGRVAANAPVANIVELPTGRVVDHFMCFMPAISPTHRFLGFIKNFPGHPGPGLISAQYLAYDLIHSPQYNRPFGASSSEPGLPVYPIGTTNTPGSNVVSPGAMYHTWSSQRLFWLGDDLLVFGDFIDGHNSLVLCDAKRGLRDVRVNTIDLASLDLVDLSRCRQSLSSEDFESIAQQPAGVIHIEQVEIVKQGWICVRLVANNCLKRQGVMVPPPGALPSGSVCGVEQLSGEETVRWLANTGGDHSPECTTEALRRIGALRYAEGASTLLRYMDFERPRTWKEKAGLFEQANRYPATEALLEIGEPAVSPVVAMIGDAARSAVSRHHGLVVLSWLFRDDQGKAVGLLMRQAKASKSRRAANLYQAAAADLTQLCYAAQRSACEGALHSAAPHEGAKRAVSGSTFSGSMSSHFKVLGVYVQTQYNTPTESNCTDQTSATVTAWTVGQTCSSAAIMLANGFVSRVSDPHGGTGSGHSTNHGDVQWPEGFCASSASHQWRQQATIVPALGGSLGNTTVAVCRDSVDLYVRGTRVFIKGEGVKTVNDACPACCQDANLAHLDNYTTDTRCQGVPSLPSALTIKLF